LFRKLGAVEVIYINEKTSTIQCINQPFDYLLVLDFEATCWSVSDTKKSHSEIIEFPVVLYDVKNDEIIDEFQQYVMPTENPKLSDFCISLTGIQQNQVDNGIPLPTCLLLFMRWITDKMKMYNMDFPNSDTRDKKKCVFATWSDWDLGICLKNECTRKRINYHDMFRKWINIKTLFKLHYQKSFSGLSGALSEVGLQFEGNQHCGLHDARNTAKLAGKMIAHGVKLQITRN
ncbi:RNase T domain containing protein, partial [Asbolus verrucosus]